jgi:hypothetical protein
MRTTISLDDDVYDSVRQYAEDRSIGLGKALSEIIRRNLSQPAPTHIVNGLTVFTLPEDSPVVTLEHVRKIESESI